MIHFVCLCCCEHSNCSLSSSSCGKDCTLKQLKPNEECVAGLFVLSFPPLSWCFSQSSPDVTVNSYQCCRHVSLFVVVIRTECRSWCRSRYPGVRCSRLSTGNSQLRFKHNAIWTNTTSTVWLRRYLTSLTVQTTSATRWFPGPSLIRYTHM